mgnify:CR=1 FL=1
MSPRIKKTRAFNVEQPLMFYKIVALSFLFLTIVLITVIVFMTSKRATITITTKEHPIDIEATVNVGDIEKQNNIEGSVTSTVIELSKTYYPTGNKQEEGVAKGTVTIYNESNRAQPLIATTRLLSKDDVLFRIKNKVIVPANGSVEANVYADKSGPSGDLAPQDKFIIPGLNEARQKDIYASSEESMRGGIKNVGILALKDVSQAKEEMRSLLKEKGIISFGETEIGNVAVYKMVQHVIEQDAEIGDEVSEFTLTGKATIAGVVYENAAIQDTADEAMSKHIIDDVSLIRVIDEPPSVSLERIDLETETAELIVYHSGVETLNPESKQLQKMLFFGKTKEEVRRYLLKLDNIYGVEVTFRPVWVSTIPYVPDHVQVIVKQVE